MESLCQEVVTSFFERAFDLVSYDGGIMITLSVW
jgi:hypothetical protein